MSDDNSTMEAHLRAAIETVVSAYGKHTGKSEYRIGAEVFGDRTFFYGILGRRPGSGSFRVRTYDVVMARFSQVWPADLPWPEGIIRIDPASVPDMPAYPAIPNPEADAA